MLTAFIACLIFLIVVAFGALIRIKILTHSLHETKKRLNATVQDVRRLRELGKLVDQAVGIVTFDQEDYAFSANSIFCHIRQLSQEAMLGSKMGEIIGLTDASVVSEIKARFRDSELWKGELLCQREDKSQFFCYVVFYPQFSDGGIYEGCMALLIDLTDSKQAQVILDRTRHLTALGEMAGSIAHEINNPLAVITMRTEVMIKKLRSNANDMSHVMPGLEKILNTTLRTTKIVDAMRRLSRIESGSLEPQSEALFKVTEEAVEFVSERAKRDSVAIILENLQSDDTHKVLALGYGLQQVLINLLANALDALEEIHETGKWIRITCQRNSTERMWELHVSNAGPRIPDSIADHLMTPFFTTKPVGKGTGLGLSLSSKIAESHGGRLYVGRKTEYTCFVLEIPIDESAPAESQSAAAG